VNNSTSQVLSSTSSASPPSAAAPAAIFVDVSGAVSRPGVYEFAEGSRVEDALASAGGLADTASTSWVAKNLNLAAKLSDGDKIYIPTQEEVKASPPPSSIVSPSGTVASAQSSSNCSKVNLNSASAGTLDECLSGIGPTYAERIVEYRKSHGGFRSIEEVQEVRGIGPATFAKIKDQLTVD
jgi:competence protein ComEA